MGRKSLPTGVPIYSKKVQEKIIIASNPTTSASMQKRHPDIAVVTPNELDVLQGQPIDAIQAALLAKKMLGGGCVVAVEALSKKKL